MQWHKQVSLSIKAERILEETIQHESKGDTIYFWARLSMDSGRTGTSESLSFWSMCDVFNGGKCRYGLGMLSFMRIECFAIFPFCFQYYSPMLVLFTFQL